MFRKILPFLGAALALTLALSAFALKPTVANATASTSTSQASSMGPGLRGDPNDPYLVKVLGITTDELQAAYEKAQSAALEQAVKDGLFTQKQADQMKSNGGRMRGFPGFGEPGSSSIDFDQLLADALGISTDKLQAAYQAAYVARLDQAVTDGKMTQDQADLMKAKQALSSSQSFQDDLKAAYTEAIQKAVSDGVITQAQADLILKSNSGFGFPGFGGGHGGPGGGPGFGAPPMDGGNGNNTPYPAPSQAPDTTSGSTSPAL